MNRSSLAARRSVNSGLSGAPFTSPDEVVAWHGAMQAQEYGLAKWSIGQRALGPVDADIDQALATAAIVRTHVLRPTWHFVAADDIRWLLALTGPRVQQHTAPRYQDLGLDHRTRARCERLIVLALEGGNRLTREEIGRVLARGGIDPSGQRLPHILMHCELEALICSGGLLGKQQTYALLDERIPPNRRRLDRDEALAELARRYLQSHGPATVQDLHWWSSLTVTDIRKALNLLDSDVRSEVIGGGTFWTLGSRSSQPRGTPHAHLLQGYDEVVVGYTESRFFGDPREAAVRAAFRDRSLPNGIVLLNDGVAGHWRRTMSSRLVTVEVLLYEALSPNAARMLEKAAADLGRFLGREARLEANRLPRQLSSL